MKFTKEQAIEKLNQELTNNGKKPLRMSARTLEGQVETLLSLVADEEMELDGFVEKVKGGLASINSNMEHDQSDFIKNYEKTHPANPPKPKPDEPQDTDDEKAELLKRLEALEQKSKDQEAAAAIEAKRADIRKYLSDNNVKDEKWISSILGIATIGQDDDVEEKGKIYLDLYNQSIDHGEPAVPKTVTSGGDGGDDSFADVKALRKRRAEVQK